MKVGNDMRNIRKNNKSDDLPQKKYNEYTVELASQTADKLRQCRKNKKISRARLDSLCSNKEFPVSYNSMINFEQPVYEDTKRQNIRGMRLASFYELCEFYNVSADYLLGFKESMHRESSADYIHREWGLNDTTLQRFKSMKKNNKSIYFDENHSFTETEFINLLLGDFLTNFEGAISKYLEKCYELKKFNENNLNSKTGLLELFDEDKAYNRMKQTNDLNEYIASIETNIDMELKGEDLHFNVEQAKFQIYKVVDKFIDGIKNTWVINSGQDKS